MSEEKLNKFAFSQAEHDADLRHKWEQESHWRFQRWFCEINEAKASFPKSTVLKIGWG